MTAPNTTESQSIPKEMWIAARDLSRRIIEISEGCGCAHCVSESTALIATAMHNAVRKFIRAQAMDQLIAMSAEELDMPADPKAGGE